MAENLAGKKYDNFTEFRKDFWKTMSKSSYASEFDKSNIWAMENGYAPKVRDKNLYSKRFGKVYNLDHIIEIQDGGYVYDLDNISILSPKAHEDKTNAENTKKEMLAKGYCKN